MSKMLLSTLLPSRLGNPPLDFFAFHDKPSPFLKGERDVLLCNGAPSKPCGDPRVGDINRTVFFPCSHFPRTLCPEFVNFLSLRCDVHPEFLQGARLTYIRFGSLSPRLFSSCRNRIQNLPSSKPPPTRSFSQRPGFFPIWLLLILKSSDGVLGEVDTSPAFFHCPNTSLDGYFL